MKYLLHILTLLLFFVNCGPTGATWENDVVPIIQRRCGECHYPGGLSVDLSAAPSLASLMLSRIEEGSMPPWMPSELSAPLYGRRFVPEEERSVLRAYLAHPQSGSSVTENTPLSKSGLDDKPDAILLPLRPFIPLRPVADEIRCLLMPPAGNSTTSWVRGYRWIVGTQRAEHHVVAGIVAPSDVARLEMRDGLDGAAGWDCTFDEHLTGSLNSSSVGRDGEYAFPRGYGVELKPDARVMLQVHYLPAFLPATGDISGVALWLASEAKPIIAATFSNPSEVPCPSGISTDATSLCSRQHAVTEGDVGAESTNDTVLKECGVTLDDYATLPFTDSRPDHWLVSSRCVHPVPFDGRLFSIRPHMHTRGASTRVTACGPGGACEILLDIPRWSWLWESEFALITPLAVTREWTLLIESSWDNGELAQWSATGEPGHYGPALAPRQPPSYHFACSARTCEMNDVVVGWSPI